MESRISPGGMPIHTGWLADGMWVAITLDNLAEVHLTRGNGDAAAKYFYATLNHGTPLYTWCEERGQEPGSTNCTGDRQHLWTPLAVVRCLRDMLVMESGDGLNLALGTPRHWLASGKPVGIAGGADPFRPGLLPDAVRRGQLAGDRRGASSPRIRPPAGRSCTSACPTGLHVTSVDPESKATVLPDGSGLRWTAAARGVEVPGDRGTRRLSGFGHGTRSRGWGKDLAPAGRFPHSGGGTAGFLLQCLVLPVQTDVFPGAGSSRGHGGRAFLNSVSSGRWPRGLNLAGRIRCQTSA